MPFAIALFLLTPQAPADTPITIKRTGNVSALLKEMSAQAKVPLTTERLGKEILIVSLNRAPLKEAMERIAWATFGQWEPFSGGYRLVRDPAAERKAEREYIDQAAAIAAAEIARFRAGVLRPGATDAEISRATLPKVLNPYSLAMPPAEARLMARLLATVNPRDLVNTRRNEREPSAVFSTEPTPAEKGFGPNSRHILEQYLAERGYPTNLPLRATLKGGVSPSGGSAQLFLWSPSNVITELWRRNAIEFQPDEPRDAIPKALLDALPKDMKVPLSDLSKRFVTPKRTNPDDNSFPSRSAFREMPEFVARLRNPEKFEPLETFVTDVWTSVATHTNSHLVANVDDTLFVPSWRGDPPPMREALGYFRRLNVQYGSGWVQVRPSLLNSPWGHRVDRAALGRYVRSGGRHQTLRALEAAAEFVTTAGTATIPRSVREFIHWAGLIDDTLSASDDWAVERFYGSLPPAVRKAWLSGTPIEVSRLPLPARIALKDWALSPNYERQPNRPEVPGLPPEPTVWFPQGAATSGWLRVEAKEEPGFATRLPSGGERWDSLDTLAWLLNAMKSGHEQVEIHESTRQSHRLYAELEPKPVSPFKWVRAYEVDPNRYVPLTRAPSDVVRRIEAERARLRTSG